MIKVIDTTKDLVYTANTIYSGNCSYSDTTGEIKLYGIPDHITSEYINFINSESGIVSYRTINLLIENTIYSYLSCICIGVDELKESNSIRLKYIHLRTYDISEYASQSYELCPLLMEEIRRVKISKLIS